MVTFEVFGEPGADTVLIRKPQLSRMSSVSLEKRPHSIPLFLFLEDLSFSIPSKTEKQKTEDITLRAWLGIGVLLQDTGTGCLIRLLPFDRDTPLIGIANVTLRRGFLVQADGLHASSLKRITSPSFGIIKLAFEAQCLGDGCLLPAFQGAGGFCKTHYLVRIEQGLEEEVALRGFHEQDICEKCGSSTECLEDGLCVTCRSWPHEHPEQWREYMVECGIDYVLRTWEHNLEASS